MITTGKGLLASILVTASAWSALVPESCAKDPQSAAPPRTAAAFTIGDGIVLFATESAFPARLFQINSDTGMAIPIASTSLLPGLDFRSDGALFASSSNLGTVSTTTGAITIIGPLPELIVSIAFSPSDELFGVSNDGQTLYKLDPRTGRSISSVPLTGTTFASTGTPFVGEINGIDFGPDGKLYGIGFSLYVIDAGTGIATRITPSGRNAAAGASILFTDLDFGPDGQLRAATTESPSNLYLINPTTGTGVLVGPMGVSVSGIASPLGVLSAPVITIQPASLTVSTGRPAHFSVAATGSPGPAYQWRKDGAMIAGATGTTLSLTSVGPASVGTYSVVVTNSVGSVTSRGATLDLTGSLPGRLVNLSILTAIERSGDSFTVGTVVGGAGTTGTSPLLIRAVGPSLVPLGVSGVLADPKVDVFSNAALAATNDNWSGSGALTSAFAQVGAFAYASADSRDSAVFLPTLARGNYTVQISGVAGATGTVIAEIYDATPASAASANTPRLINVSVLKDIPAGGTLTAGFVVAGSASANILIRAVGPGLAQFGVTGAMADPLIRLFDAGTRLVASNDNWGGSPPLVAAFSAVGAFALESDGRDAAVLVTLPPGSYTAQVSGAPTGAGSVLVEVYEVP